MEQNSHIKSRRDLVGVFFLMSLLLSYNVYCAEPNRSLSPKQMNGPKTVVTLKIVTFNIQDIMLVSKARPERMRAIGETLSALNPDIAGFQESFIKKDRQILIDSLNTGTRLRYHQYYPSRISGSGLLISSAFPIKQYSFRQFKHSNPFYKLTEGDWWAGKGVALARIEFPNGFSLNFYNTHAQADYSNSKYTLIRKRQMVELANFINQSNTDSVPAILVGDMNCRPSEEDFETAVDLAKLIRLMTIDSGIDHILGVKNRHYNFEILDTVKITKTITVLNKTMGLSDHTGYMSKIRITRLH
jgi:endonuclease/exonuclease/phosphatase family metal-dependent hydrolase